MKSAVGPYWLSPNNDPAYLYLVNFLYLIDNITPNFTDHPGTTLQVLGACIIKLLHFSENTSQIISNVLRNPELYLNIIHSVLLFLYTLTLMIVGGYALYKSKNLLSSFLLQSSAFLYLTFNL